MNSELDTSLISSAKNGQIDALEEYLSMVDDSKEYINRIYRIDQDQQCTLLALACLHGRVDLLRYILEHYPVDLEITNNIYLEDSRERKQIYYNVTVLWIATSINHFLMVQLLVEHGANVNHTSKTNSTPLRSACFNGNLQMVRYLVAHGGNVHIAKHNNDTNLAVAVFRQHTSVVKFLVEELGCDVNICDDDGRSPLFDAVNCGSLELTRFLLEHGARNFPAKCDLMTPLMWAAEKARLDLIDAIIPHCSIIEQIEAKELFASVLISNDIDHATPLAALQHLSQSLELRSLYHLPKPPTTTRISIFRDKSECRTIAELNNRRLHHNETWWIEALLIRERLLGPKNRKYRYSLRYQGAVLLENHDYLSGMELLLHELELCREYAIPIVQQNVRDLISILCEMYSMDISMPIEALQRLFQIIIDGFLQSKIAMDQDAFLYDLLFLISLISRYILKETTPVTHRQQMIRSLRLIDHSKFVTRADGSSLLHLALNENVSADEFFIDHLCQYPCLQTARFLVQYGAQVNGKNAIGNTPLHVVTANTVMGDQNLLEFLWQNGAHLDQTNSRGHSALELATDPAVIAWFKTRALYSLKCLCARMIQKKNLAFRDKISRPLVAFVENH